MRKSFEVIPFDSRLITDTHPFGWQEFHSVRNLVIDTLRPFGTVGGLGPARITADANGPPPPWPVENDDPNFYVVDEYSNPFERFVRVEPLGTICEEAVVALANALRTFPTWGVGLAAGDGYIMIQPDRLMVKGPQFEGCRDWASVMKALEVYHPDLPRPQGKTQSAAEWLGSDDEDAQMLRALLHKDAQDSEK